MVNVRGLVALALALDHDQRRRNYEEFRERVEGNIQRWEEQLRRNADAQQRTRGNIAKNKDRLIKTGEFLERMNSASTQEWLERNERNAREHRNPDVRQAAARKVSDHHAKVSDARSNFERTQAWIEEGQSKLYQMENRERELKSKISDANSKI